MVRKYIELISISNFHEIIAYLSDQFIETRTRHRLVIFGFNRIKMVAWYCSK